MLRIIRWWDQISGKSPTLYSYKLGTRHLPFLPDFWWRHVHAFSVTPDDDSLELGFDTPAFSLTFWELLTPLPTTALYRSDNTNLLHWPGVGNNGSLGQSSGAGCVHKEKLVWNTKLRCFQHSLKPVWEKLNPCLKHKGEAFSAQSQTCLISCGNLSEARSWDVFSTILYLYGIKWKLVWNTKLRSLQHNLKPVWIQSETLSVTYIRAIVKWNCNTLSICTTLKDKLFYFYYCSHAIQACFLKKILFAKKYARHFCPAVVFWSLKRWLTISVCPYWLGNATQY